MRPGGDGHRGEYQHQQDDDEQPIPALHRHRIGPAVGRTSDDEHKQEEGGCRYRAYGHPALAGGRQRWWCRVEGGIRSRRLPELPGQDGMAIRTDYGLRAPIHATVGGCQPCSPSVCSVSACATINRSISFRSTLSFEA